MSDLQFDVLVDQRLIDVLPELAPYSGKRTSIQVSEVGTKTHKRLTLQELLARRIKRPAGSPKVSVEDMEAAIARESHAKLVE